MRKYFIKTFGCQANTADSERIAAALQSRGMQAAQGINEADYVVINTCMVRQSAENRVYGLINNLEQLKTENRKSKIILTGCMVGMAVKDPSGKFLRSLKKKLPAVDEFLPIEEVGFDTAPRRTNSKHAWVPISNGCNNFCSYCVVPFTRGREVSRPYDEIIAECLQLREQGCEGVTLLGQNVNSYGADLISSKCKVQSFAIGGRKVKPVYVKHLGRYRIPTLFPYLLEDVAKMGFDKVDFVSSNPWDFSDELIAVIARNKNITRTIHLPVQSGDDEILKKMNRWYTSAQYLSLISKLKGQIPNVRFTTDIIVGFCGETEEQFQNTIELCKKVGFDKAYIAMYSPRPQTASKKFFKDDVPHNEKKRRFRILDDIINKV
jgi:tRNA-2-methylthio-N6-dimethylallyladenosine synthase